MKKILIRINITEMLQMTTTEYNVNKRFAQTYVSSTERRYEHLKQIN